MNVSRSSGRLRSLFIAAIAWLTAACPTPTSFAQPASAQPAHTFAIGESAFLLDDQPFVIRCGEVHAARVPKEYWRHRLQMAKAMGLNTVCAYLFWNQHEPRPGEFNWQDRADVAEYCRIAQELGLWVILRPGPYACAEWEMGGLPWWLLKHDDIRLRSRDPNFIEPTRRYLAEVGRELAPLQITRGGPIIMVQVENEYGFYGDDAAYMGEIRQALLDAGFDVPLFACNPKDQLRRGYRDDLFPVVNFGSDPAGAFRALRRILPKGPLMCGEFYPGWFDTWGAPHHTGNTEQYLADLEYMLEEQSVVQHLHGPRRHDVRLRHGRRPPVQARHVQLRLRRPHQRSRLADREVLEDPRAVRPLSQPGRNDSRAAGEESGHRRFRRRQSLEIAPLLDNLPGSARPTTRRAPSSTTTRPTAASSIAPRSPPAPPRRSRPRRSTTSARSSSTANASASWTAARAASASSFPRATPRPRSTSSSKRWAA